MDWRNTLCLSGALIAIWPSIVAAKEFRLPSSSKWQMDYATDSCQLARQFGEGENQTIVLFTRYEPSPHFDLSVIGKPVGSPEGRIPVRLRFGTSGDFVQSEAMVGQGDKKSALFLTGRLDNIDIREFDSDDVQNMSTAQLTRLQTIAPETERAVSSMTLVAKSRTLVLELGSMGAPMAEMRKCVSDLIKSWGLDPDEQAALVSRPQPKNYLGGWITSSDYPTVSSVRGEQAIIRFRLMVNAMGETTACVVQSAIAKGDFAATTCDLLKRRARFEPARNTSNQSVASYFVGKVQWVIQ